MSIVPAAVLAFAVIHAPLLPQVPKPPLVLQIVDTARGREEPRNASSPAAAHGAYRLCDRQLHWQLGTVQCPTAADLRRALGRIYTDRSQWGPDPQHPGQQQPRVIDIQPGPHCCWADVLATCDLVKAGKFEQVALHDAWQQLQLGCLVPDSVIGDGEIILPIAKYNAPPKAPADAWQPTFDLLQDGRVRLHDTVLHEPKLQHNDRTALQAALQNLVAQARERGLVARQRVDGVDREIVTAPILLRADRYVEWRHVQQGLHDLDTATPRFAAIQIAVSDRDAEPAFVEQHQRPK